MLMTKKILCLVLAVMMIALSACGGKEEKKNTELKIGVSGMEGNFNPFFCEGEADGRIINQVYPTVLRFDSAGKPVNNFGSITYEYTESGKVKYTVTLRDNLYYSDGTAVSVDDIIFWYHVIADASYTGPYAGFRNCGIEGLMEYYTDDPQYSGNASKYAGNTSLAKSYIADNYENGIDVKEISGIKRIDNHTCTILFDSRNINSLPAVNARIVPRSFFGADYIKGAADKIKEIRSETLGCGKYEITEYSEKDGRTVLGINKYYAAGAVSGFEAPFFTKIEFRDIEPGKLVKEAADGKVDIIKAPATPDTLSALNSASLKTFITNDTKYTSLFISAKVPVDARQILMSLCSPAAELEKAYGSYRTQLTRPMNVRFDEYPAGAQLYYGPTMKSSFLSTIVTSLTAYYTEGGEEVDRQILESFAQGLSDYGVKLNILPCKRGEIGKLAKSGKADMWIMSVEDGATPDKYDYYHSSGVINYTGISDTGIDELTEKIRAATGFTDRKALYAELLDDIMELAIELPLYELQYVTAFSTAVVDAKSLEDAAAYADYSDMLDILY